MRKTPIALLAACLGLAGPASVALAGLFSASGMVIAILDGELFLGEAEGHLNGAGTLAIHSQKNPGLTCVGQFTSSAKLGGKGQLKCSDGASATFRFERLDIYSGHGVGDLSRGSMSFTYGLSVKQAKPYLKLPKGKQLAHNGQELALIDR